MTKHDAIRMTWDELHAIEADPFADVEIFVGIDGEIHAIGDTLDYTETYLGNGEVMRVYADGTVLFD